MELAILILATGHDGMTGALTAFDVVGRGGVTVNDEWKAGARLPPGLIMAGFPNLFMTPGPNGPAALANIIGISEHDEDWIWDAMVHMKRHGLATMEPTLEADDRWMELVFAPER